MAWPRLSHNLGTALKHVLGYLLVWQSVCGSNYAAVSNYAAADTRAGGGTETFSVKTPRERASRSLQCARGRNGGARSLCYEAEF